MTRPTAPVGRRTVGQRLVLAFNCMTIVALLATAGGLTYVYSKYSQLPRVELGSVLTGRSDTGTAANFLLVGIDSAANLAADDPVRAGREDVTALRSDTMMILRVDPAAQRASLLSLPRDLWVPLPTGGRQRINTAIENGGPAALIDTIEQYFGIPVNHYVQIDFAGFQELVDVVGGVEVYFAHPARDTRSGLDIAEPGCVSLDGPQALSYVRSRHFQTFEDGRWRTDPTADLGRIGRQQDFIIRALRRSVQQGIRNPVTLDRLVNAALETVAVDDQLTADDIIDLARAFRGFDPGALDLYDLPVTEELIGGAQVLRLVDAEAQATLDIFRGTDPGDLRPSDVRVLVLNGSGIAGQAGELRDSLAQVGFGTAGVGEAESFDHAATVVRYAPGGEAKADLVARHLEPAPALEVADGPLGAEVVVVTGAQPVQVRSVPRPVGATSTTSAATSSPSTSVTTTTTEVGVVPDSPPGIEC